MNWMRLGLYVLGIVLSALAGAAVALLGRGSARRLEFFLAASAGVMLGVVGLHMLPEAFEAGPRAAVFVVFGFLFMLIVERFVLPHAMHAPHAAEAHEHCDPADEVEHARADAAGIGTFIGLALHTLGDGIALGAAIENDEAALLVFLAIVAHKIPSAFALGSILTRAGATRWRVLGASAALGLTVGVGALLFRLIGADAGEAVTPYAVAFSAGSFMHVAVTDLLPDLHRSGRTKGALLGALAGGLVFVFLVGMAFPE